MRRGTNWSLLLAGATSVLLAASTLSRVYTNLSYLPELVGAIAVAFAAGWLSRRLDVPAVLAPAVSFVALVEYLTLVYFREHAFGRMLPTTSAFRDAGDTVRTAMQDIRTLASPVEPTAELVMITVAGVFAVAVVVDLLVFRSRRPVTAGLALLSLFIIPASLSPTGAGWLNFCLAAAGYLGLLTVEGRERVRRWGRRLAPDRAAADEMGDAVPLFRVARGIGATAIGLALVVPGIVPGLGNGILSGSGGRFGFGGSGGGGGGSPVLDNPVVNIRPSLRSNRVEEWLRVRTDSPAEYLRLAVLDTFNGQKWEMGFNPAQSRQEAKNRDLPLPPGLEATTPTERYSARIEASDDFAETWLPVPYSISRLNGISGKWWLHNPTRIVYSPNKKIRGSDYEVEAVIARPDPAAVSVSTTYPAEVQQLASLRPGVIDVEVRNLAVNLTEDYPTPWAKVVALQEFFTSSDFVYSLDVPPPTQRDAIRNFLEQRIGYCEQFAGTMAVMVRAIGLPSRVVVGFTPGTFQGDYWSITNRDLHAWPEVYFPGTGWVRFEPTPPQAGGGINVPPHATAPPENPRTRSPGPNGSPFPTAGNPSLPPGVLERIPRQQPGGGAPPTGSDTSSTRMLVAMLGALAVLVLPTLPAATRALLRRRERARAPTDAERAHVAWHHLEDDASDLGFGWPASASPRAAARDLIAGARLTDEAVAAVRRLARAEQIARYARTAGPADGLDRDVAAVRSALLADVSRKQRLNAMLLPRSTMRQVSNALADGYVRLLRRWDRSMRALRRRIGLSRAGA
jgi:transglutaminase-like putative cysteine protease